MLAVSACPWKVQAVPCALSRSPPEARSAMRAGWEEAFGFVGLACCLWSATCRGHGGRCSRCSRRSADTWVAPLVHTKGAPSKGNLALGAVEQNEVRRLYGQVFSPELQAWKPVLLQQTGPQRWEDGGGLCLDLSLEDLIAAVPGREGVEEPAPAWPAELREELAQWPLKGPGTLVFDPNFFVQRGAARVLLGPGPVLFPGAAAALGLPTADCTQALRAAVAGRSLQAVLGKADSMEGLLGGLPPSLQSGHFDLPTDASSTCEAVMHQPLDVLELESRSWTCGAVVRELKGPEAGCIGCRVGDFISKIDGADVMDLPFDDVVRRLRAGPLKVSFARPDRTDFMYLREVPAVPESMAPFLGGEPVDMQQLVPALAEHLAGGDLFFHRATPMLFAGDGGTASHLHIDAQGTPLVQFCHVLHGTKLLLTAPRADAEPGPVLPWGSEASEVRFPAGGVLQQEAAEWLLRPEVSVAAAGPGDLLLFQGQAPHAGCNGTGELNVSLFHSAQPIRAMLEGAFGPAYQALAQRMTSGKSFCGHLPTCVACSV
ncbi:unnamed protein product [Effrenium voratum]|uniref:PDZ domain-containing protein n=1 Tax=Effrenium voratum TaxID=2562239 RepID=A0AA36IM08_9DINO|nr:unnamed protein product [Effrenium voratum]